MSFIYISSATERAGKTLLCAGLAKAWMEKGKKVGYLKISGSETLQAVPDKDVLFMKNILGLKESPDEMSLTLESQSGAVDRFKQACAALSSDKDVVVIEGLALTKFLPLLETPGLRILVIHDYCAPLATTLESYKKPGSGLMGVILNKVPRNQIAATKEKALKELEQSGINLLGVIPEDRILMSMSVNDLAESVQGKILNCPDMADEIIENIMMGSSTFDRGPAYYNRKNNKAVLIWGERPGYRKAALAGLQSAALQTSVRCIVISNNGTPLPAAAQKAEEKKVPIITAPGDLKSIINLLENNMKMLRFNQEKKLPRLSEILSRSLNNQLLAGCF